jgi:hypothetical protein
MRRKGSEVGSGVGRGLRGGGVGNRNGIILHDMRGRRIFLLLGFFLGGGISSGNAVENEHPKIKHNHLGKRVLCLIWASDGEGLTLHTTMMLIRT